MCRLTILMLQSRVCIDIGETSCCSGAAAPSFTCVSSIMLQAARMTPEQIREAARTAAATQAPQPDGCVCKAHLVHGPPPCNVSTWHAAGSHAPGCRHCAVDPSALRHAGASSTVTHGRAPLPRLPLQCFGGACFSTSAGSSGSRSGTVRASRGRPTRDCAGAL